jgi:hypothetical protein
LGLFDFRSLGVSKITDFDECAGLVATDERVFELDVPMGDTRFVQVLDAANQLLEEVAGIVLWEPPRLANKAKQFTTWVPSCPSLKS